MRVGIYTNRLPYPPIGGIPSFLNGLFRGLSVLGVESCYLLPNALEVGSYGISNQHHIEATLAEALRSTSLPVSDVTISLSEWRKQIVYSSDEVIPEIIPLAGLSVAEVANLITAFDLVILAGSPLLFISTPSMEQLLLRLQCPILLAVLFPLAEIEFYCGAQARAVIAQLITIISKHVSAVVAPSTYVMRELQDECRFTAPVKLIRHGVNERLFERLIFQPTDALPSRRALLISRATTLAQHKNISLIYRLWPMVRERVHDAVLTLIGPGIWMSDGQVTIPGIDLVGEVDEDEKIRLFRDSRVLVTASNIEAFGLTVAEGLAAGVPCVGFHQHAVGELIKNDINGFLVHATKETGANEKSLVEAIVAVLSDDAYFLRLRSNCFLTPELRGWSKMAADYLAVAGLTKVA